MQTNDEVECRCAPAPALRQALVASQQRIQVQALIGHPHWATLGHHLRETVAIAHPWLQRGMPYQLALGPAEVEERFQGICGVSSGVAPEVVSPPNEEEQQCGGGSSKLWQRSHRAWLLCGAVVLAALRGQ
eukprot:591617-Alexandrium_andersonii.AAC.1